MPYVILTVSAALSAGIWLLGVGVPETEHQAMGWLFVALHVTALLIALNPPKTNPNIPVLVCLSIVPLEIASIFFLGAVQQAYLKYRPNSDEFIQLCSTAGSRFSSKPSKPVESIAYDWGEKSYAPIFSHFSIDHKRRVSSMASGSRYEQFPNSIKFKESRCCRNTGRVGFQGRRVHRWLDAAPSQEWRMASLYHARRPAAVRRRESPTGIPPHCRS